MERLGTRIRDKNEPLHMAHTLKLFAQSEVEAGMLIMCPILGLTQVRLLSRGNQVLLAMDKLIKVAKIFL